jgi:hypothetical protein
MDPGGRAFVSDDDCVSADTATVAAAVVDVVVPGKTRGKGGRPMIDPGEAWHGSFVVVVPGKTRGMGGRPKIVVEEALFVVVGDDVMDVPGKTRGIGGFCNGLLPILKIVDEV